MPFAADISHIIRLYLLLLLASPLLATPAAPTLPTNNDYIFKGERSKFYMYVNRSFEGKYSQSWSAGKYGFVRDLKRTKDGVIGTKFHEGIDIAPLERDKSNRALDEIYSIDNGTVAYVNSSSNKSTYGKYIVIEHNWDSGPIYSLYAHLAEISVQAGDTVTKGLKIGIMGYTGAGLKRARSHLHLELNLLLSTGFDSWYDKHFKGSKNLHGNYNGLNMSGLNIGTFYIAQNRDATLTIPRFVKSQKIYYQVTIPRNGPLALLDRYPWLLKGSPKRITPSWELSFTASGLPVSVAPSMRQVSAPRITSVVKCLSQHEYHTKGILNGTGYRATLSKAGTRYIELISALRPPPTVTSEPPHNNE